MQDAHNKNLALLAKYSWRLLHDTNSLWARALHTKYLQNRDVTEANNYRYASTSSTWRGLLAGIPLLVKGLTWQLGMGDALVFGAMCGLILDL